MNKSETEQILKKIALLKSKIQKMGNSGQVELYKKKNDQEGMRFLELAGMPFVKN